MQMAAEAESLLLCVFSVLLLNKKSGVIRKYCGIKRLGTHYLHIFD